MTDSLSFFRSEEVNQDLWIILRKKILWLYAFMAGPSRHRITEDELQLYRPTNFTNSDWDLLKVRIFPAVERLAYHFNTTINHVEYPNWEKELLDDNQKTT